MGQLRTGQGTPVAALARSGMLGVSGAAFRLVALGAATITLVFVILAAWTTLRPDTLSAEARSAIRAECTDRVAAGLNADMATCVSWAAEARLDARRASEPINPLPLVMALAAGALAGSIVHLATARAPGAGGRPSACLVPLSGDRA